MNDDLGLFSDEPEEPRRRGRRERRSRLRQRRRRSWITALAGLAVLAVVAGGVVYGVGKLWQVVGYADFDGPGTGEVVVQVKHGDSTRAIARTLQHQGVVASTKAFVKAGKDNSQISGIQPGYYLMRNHMSGAAAVQRIVSPDARAGRLEIRAGERMDDVHGPNGTVSPGILAKLSKASCTAEHGQKRCVSPQELRATARSADPASLGVPHWAATAVRRAPPKHRLEGLFMPGTYNVKPGATAQELLRSVLTSSVAKLDAAGMPSIAENSGLSPYQVLTVASLAQSEAITDDFNKVTRVVENRMQDGMPLQFDSTVNYALDRPTLLTRAEDRARSGPYNTYRTSGLPPTPISSVSRAAVKAAAHPADGDWKYFVKCDKSGRSCFSSTPQQHRHAIEQAQERGVY